MDLDHVGSTAVVQLCTKQGTSENRAIATRRADQAADRDRREDDSGHAGEQPDDGIFMDHR